MNGKKEMVSLFVNQMSTGKLINTIVTLRFLRRRGIVRK